MLAKYKPGGKRPNHNSANHFFSTLHNKSLGLACSSDSPLTTFDYASLLSSIPEINATLTSGRPADVFPLLSRLTQASDSRQPDLLFDLFLGSGILVSILKLVSLNESETVPLLPSFFCLVENIVRSSPRNAVLAIQAGALDFCLRHFFTRYELINTGLRQVFSAWIETSHFVRALVYSSRVLHRCAEELENPDHFVMVEEWSAKLLLDFIHEGPTSGQVVDVLSDDEARQQWNAFRSGYYFDDIFDEDMFMEFITVGLDLSDERPTFHLIRHLLQSRVPTAVGSLLRAITELVDRDEAAEPKHRTAQRFLEGPPLGLHASLSAFMDLRAPVVWETLMAAYAAIYFAVPTAGTVVREQVAHDAFALISELRCNPHGRGVVISACHALTNVFGTEPSIVPRALEEPESMSAIDRLIFDGCFDIKAAGMWLFLEVVVHGGADCADAQHVQAMCELFSGRVSDALIDFIVCSLNFLFQREEGKITKSRLLVNVFDDYDGFSLVCEIEGNTTNKELEQLCHEFWDTHHCDLDVVKNLDETDDR
jgi:hypothetical protein